MNILFICTENIHRSKTAEETFKHMEQHQFQSAGTSSTATQAIDDKLIAWADMIFVMEKHHANRIHKKHPLSKTKRMINLDIEDDYEYMDLWLVKLLKSKIMRYL